MKNNTSKKKYTIKVPVFTSERFELNEGMFPINYDNVIYQAIESINLHNLSNVLVSSDRKNKTIKRVIDKIKIHEIRDSDIPFLILQISAYNTNWEGSLITSENVLPISNNDKIGSDNNFILLYPQIIGNENKTIFWIILVYDDPKKESNENISTAKIVLTKILKKPVKNIKLPTVLKELKEGKILPQIKLNLNSVSYNENFDLPTFEKYCISSKLSNKKEYEFKKYAFC